MRRKRDNGGRGKFRNRKGGNRKRRNRRIRMSKKGMKEKEEEQEVQEVSWLVE